MKKPVTRIGFHNAYESLSIDDYLFNHVEAPIGDGLLKPFNALAIEAKRRGIECHTLDRFALPSGNLYADAYVFMDVPGMHPLVEAAFESGKPCYLITWENPMIMPRNWEHAVHLGFEKVMTWADDLVARGHQRPFAGLPQKYVKINYSHDIVVPREDPDAFDRRLATMIACNKSSSNEHELYSERRRVIDAFGYSIATGFDLYGHGWDPLLTAYRGTVDRKRPILARYRFTFCYENAYGFSGYITEKLFDALLAGSVPVYLGAPNVTDHIPPACFIDAREFEGIEGINYSALIGFLRSMPRDIYNGHLAAGRAFLASEKAAAFSIERFVETVLTTVAG